MAGFHKWRHRPTMAAWRKGIVLHRTGRENDGRASTDNKYAFRSRRPGGPVPNENLRRGTHLQRPQYSVTADGRFLMNVITEETSLSPITVILNWHPEQRE